MAKMSNFKFRVIVIPIIAFLAVAVLIATILANVYPATLDWYLGRGEKHIVTISGVSAEDTEYYENKYDGDSYAALLASAEMSGRVGDEGEVLLKNISNTLPLAKGDKVTPFGYGYVNPTYGGTGSGKVDASKDYVVTAEEALNEYFTVNKTAEDKLKAAQVMKLSGPTVQGQDVEGYRGADQRIHYFPASTYSGLEESCAGTVGLVFISRNGGEGNDMFRDVANGYDDGTRHYLQLSEEEKLTLDFSKAHCSKTVVIINSPTPMELTGLRDDDGIGAVLWIGSAGARGMDSMGRILSGAVNPSGKTVDIWTADFASDPTFVNYGASDSYYTNLDTAGKPTNYVNNFIEYEEGIYIGYRYYETCAAEDNTFSVFGEKKDYDDAVVYPFGYGLNYGDAEVTQTLDEVTYSGGEITIKGTVSNDSDYDVKEVVQIYYGAPYKPASGIEKSAKTLVAFEKIDVKAGEDKPFTIVVDEEELASYDYKGYYTDGAGSYVLESGEYGIYLGKDSHDSWGSEKIDVRQTLAYADEASGGARAVGKRDCDYEAAQNLFDESNDYAESGMMTVMSRADFDGTAPTAPAPKAATESIIAGVSGYDVETDPISGDNENSLLYKSEDPVSGAKNGTVLSSLRGLAYDDPMWDDLLDNIDYTSDELDDLLSYGAYRTGGLSQIEKTVTADRDGPVGLTAGGSNALVASTWMSTPIVAATWNVDLAYEMGACIGQEAMNHDVHGWYAPGVNLHRSPFGGRNFEYFSEDPLISGKMGAGVISGAQQNGLYTYVKHFALNEQETNRITSATWVDEQTMREIYFKAFEICVKDSEYELTYYDGGSGERKTVTRNACTALMTAMNSIGSEFCGNSYALLTELLREEWGFRGMVVTDMTLPNEYKSLEEGYRVGNDVWMYLMKTNMDFATPTAKWAARNAVHNICYAVVNSGTYNHVAPGAYIYYDISPWAVWLIVANVVIWLAVAGALVWIALRTMDEKKHPEKYAKKNKGDVSES